MGCPCAMGLGQPSGSGLSGWFEENPGLVVVIAVALLGLAFWAWRGSR